MHFSALARPNPDLQSRPTMNPPSRKARRPVLLSSATTTPPSSAT